MGILDFIFGKKPEWLLVTESQIEVNGNMNKSDAKKIFKMYLEECGFDDREFIKEEVECLADEMKEFEEDTKEDIKSHEEEISEFRKDLSLIKKTKKDPEMLTKSESKRLSEERDLDISNPSSFDEAIEDLEGDIRNYSEEIEEWNKDLKETKADWKKFFVNYINNRAKQEADG